MRPLSSHQALLQCGTPACGSALLQLLRGVEGPSPAADALIYALSLLPDPEPHRVTDMLTTAQTRQSKAVMYALANTARR